MFRTLQLHPYAWSHLLWGILFQVYIPFALQFLDFSLLQIDIL
jgi:hypothetical protein